MSTERGATPITIRFPPEVAEAIRHLAREHDRSLTGEVVRAVWEYMLRQQQGEREGDQRP